MGKVSDREEVEDLRVDFLIQRLPAPQEVHVMDTHGSTGEVYPDVSMPQDRLWCLLHVPSVVRMMEDTASWAASTDWE